MESDIVIKSSVENLVPILSESKDFSDNENTLIDSSPKFDYLLELAHIDPILPGIEEADFDLEEEIRLVEDFSYDILSSTAERTYYEYVDMIHRVSPLTSSYHKLLSNDTLPLPKIESSNFDHFNDPSFPRPPPEPPDVEICFDIEPDTIVKNDFEELNEDECFAREGGVD
ncbi:hypothetical protein Tco_0381686 [Tanacetum coccineum]